MAYGSSPGNATVPDTGDWVKVFDPAHEPALRMVCCPYAGSSAQAFTALAAALAPSIEALSIQYPGRPGHRGTPAISDVGVLADRIGDALAPWVEAPEPLAVYGHSMGSVVAFEVARRLEKAGKPPVRLFVSGRGAPSAGLGGSTPQTDSEIVAELRELGAVPGRLLDSERYRASILKVVKNDYLANSTYRADAETAVHCPMTFLCAEDDPYLSPEAAAGWERHTTGAFRTVHFSGGHFFLNEHIHTIAEEFRTCL